jgi:hypothetical protein
MAAATSIAMAGVGLLGSGYQAIKGAKDARDAKNALDNYQRQEFNNIAEGMQVSTLGADLQREEQARLAATQVGALQGAGVRGVLGGLGRVEAGNQMLNRQIGAELDAQQKQIDQMYAQDEANIRNMQEQREMQDISGLSSQYNAGNQQMMQGIGGMAQSTISGLGAWDKSIKDKKKPPTPPSESSNTSTTENKSSFDFYKNMGDIAKGFGSPTSNQFGQVPSNLGGFVQSQFVSPQNNLFQR